MATLLAIIVVIVLVLIAVAAKFMETAPLADGSSGSQFRRAIPSPRAAAASGAASGAANGGRPNNKVCADYTVPLNASAREDRPEKAARFGRRRVRFNDSVRVREIERIGKRSLSSRV